jgi:ubiquitin carboxyl-terminal hydrolase 4/11/15
MQQASKQLNLWKLPKLLVVHLKRFSMSNRMFRDKIDAVVDFPLENLDLTQYELANLPENQQPDTTEPSTPAIYDLYGVAVSLCFLQISERIF